MGLRWLMGAIIFGSNGLVCFTSSGPYKAGNRTRSLGKYMLLMMLLDYVAYYVFSANYILSVLLFYFLYSSSLLLNINNLYYKRPHSSYSQLN